MLKNGHNIDDQLDRDKEGLFEEKARVIEDDLSFKNNWVSSQVEQLNLTRGRLLSVYSKWTLSTVRLVTLTTTGSANLGRQ